MASRNDEEDDDDVTVSGCRLRGVGTGADAGGGGGAFATDDDDENSCRGRLRGIFFVPRPFRRMFSSCIRSLGMFTPTSDASFGFARGTSPILILGVSFICRRCQVVVGIVGYVEGYRYLFLVACCSRRQE